MSKCENCRLRKESARAFDIHWHGEDDCPYEVCPEIKTNADRIRSMTDEELATLISSDWCEIVCGPETNCKYADCRGKILDWLRREVGDVGQ